MAHLVLLNFPVPTTSSRASRPPAPNPTCTTANPTSASSASASKTSASSASPSPATRASPKSTSATTSAARAATNSAAASSSPARSSPAAPSRSSPTASTTKTTSRDPCAANSKSPAPHSPRRHPRIRLENRLASRLRFSKTKPLARIASPPGRRPTRAPAPGSLEEFIIEHYWGYTHGRDGQTREYQVAHVPWRIAAADNVTWDCDIAANYNSPLAEFLARPPTSAFIAEGSPVQVFRGQCLYRSITAVSSMRRTRSVAWRDARASNE